MSEYNNYTTGYHLELYANEETRSALPSTVKTNIDNLIEISNMVKDGKNLIFGSCTLGSFDNFGTTLVSLVDAKIDLFENGDLTTSWSDPDTGIIDFKRFGLGQTSDSKHSIGWKRYNKSDDIETYKNVMFNQYGIRTVKE